MIVKNQHNLHIVKFATEFTFILLTLCAKNLSFRYKSSNATKIIPSSVSETEEGTRAWRRLRLQRETKNQVSLLCARVGDHLSEDRNRERIGDLDILRRLQRNVGDGEP